MQHTRNLLMIEPVNFGFNSETAENNVFQVQTSNDRQQQALEEFNAFVSMLRQNKLDVTVIKDSPEPFTPDSIFPNNWISFHKDGRIILYPMFAPNRRNERKANVLGILRNKLVITGTLDLTKHELAGQFLEGTGSMVLDRDNMVAYACRSVRTDQQLLENFCEETGYSPILFNAKDRAGHDIYHTNVLMCVADRYCVICLDVVEEGPEKEALIAGLNQSGKEIIEISVQQLHCFAGNMLQVSGESGETLLVMSTQAFQSLTTVQLIRLQKYNRIIHSPLDTIESAGGGSARCMIAEIFNPLK